MRPFLLVGATCLALLFSFSSAFPHPEAGPDQEEKEGIDSWGQSWKVKGEYRDTHWKAHGEPQGGVAEVVAWVVSAPAGFEAGGGVYTIKLVASLWTPLTQLVRAEAQVSRSPRGYFGFAHENDIWKAPPTDATGQLYLAFGMSFRGRITQVGHKECATANPVSATAVAPEETTIQAGGIPEVEVDEETGEVVEIVRDGNGDIVWEEPPVSLARLTSSVTESGGVHTYTYRIDNFGDYPLDFVVPEITTPAFPSGWYGTVDASSYEEISLQNGTDDPYSQHATLSATDTDDDLSSEQITTGVVYVPESRLAFGGTNTITDYYYDSVLQANVVEFRVSEDAALALLLRIDATGEEIVDELASLSTGLFYELVDDSFLPGSNDYRVRTGSGVNGWEDDDVVVIVNQ